ncbi:hypothetical protein AYW79_09180 [Ferroacidibacillus organovorans]|uniref:Uncharacterized protein n=1 Tax=Ferroacidibacillus organovorans TaxID=1765683 RepID=A0A853KC71_9BACL|nr:hypothetical protein AYJ22_05795 [Ferroacidibacillus organovorans]OAG93739.1 hypothetical protein AYW79_09180 [Ferroacidibacillus organovorans]
MIGLIFLLCGLITYFVDYRPLKKSEKETSPQNQHPSDDSNETYFKTASPSAGRQPSRTTPRPKPSKYELRFMKFASLFYVIGGFLLIAFIQIMSAIT